MYHLHIQSGIVRTISFFISLNELRTTSFFPYINLPLNLYQSLLCHNDTFKKNHTCSDYDIILIYICFKISY